LNISWSSGLFKIRYQKLKISNSFKMQIVHVLNVKISFEKRKKTSKM
jgi:hypothetical protein